MNERDEVREAVKTEFGVTVSTAQIDRRLQETYASLGEMPQAKKTNARRVLKWVGGGLGSAAAAFLVLLGVSAANPAFAANLPVMQSIISFFRGGSAGFYQDPVIMEGGIEPYVKTVADTAQQDSAVQVTETYCDGKTLVASVKVTLPQAKEEYRRLQAEFELTAGETPITDYWAGNYNSATSLAMARVDDTSYVGSIVLDVEKLNLPETFTLHAVLNTLTAVDDKLMVLDPADEKDGSSYRQKTYPLEWQPQTASTEVKNDPSLQKVYEVGKTQNGCTLEKITATPALTQIDVACDRDGVVMFAYGDDGKELTRMSKYGEESAEIRYYTALKKDASSVTVKFFDKNDKYNAIAEFTVPVEGGYAGAVTEISRRDDGVEVVYDPPLPETDSNTRNQEGVEVTQLGETFTTDYSLLSGTMDVTFHNLRVYRNWQEAGIADEDMNDTARWNERMLEQDYRFVLLDITVETKDAVPSINLDENYNESGEPGTGTYWISSFAMPALVDYKVGEETASYIGEVEYFSDHSNGISDYYHFRMDSNEKKTMQVGYMVPVEQLRLGNFQLSAPLNTVVEIDGYMTNPMRYINIPAYEDTTE